MLDNFCHSMKATRTLISIMIVKLISKRREREREGESRVFRWYMVIRFPESVLEHHQDRTFTVTGELTDMLHSHLNPVIGTKRRKPRQVFLQQGNCPWERSPYTRKSPGILSLRIYIVNQLITTFIVLRRMMYFSIGENVLKMEWKKSTKSIWYICNGCNIFDCSILCQIRNRQRTYDYY